MNKIQKLINTALIFAVIAMIAVGVQAQNKSEDSGYKKDSGYRYERNDDDDDDDDDEERLNCSGGTSNDNRRYKGRLNVVGLTSDQRLVCFNEFKPEKAQAIGTVNGFTGGDSELIGIDFRVQDGLLYGVGNAGGVYTINTTTATLTFVNRLTVALNGTFFGVDFNPAADRLRIVSDNGQNLRHNVNANGVTINDAALSYAAPATAIGITGAAYTNNDLDLNTATTLFDIDSNLDQVAIQSPANSGTLVATGRLLVDTTPSVGFDIYSTIRNSATVNNEAFASLTTSDGFVRFYSVSLLTGNARSRGTFRNQDRVVDIAIPLRQR